MNARTTGLNVLLIASLSLASCTGDQGAIGPLGPIGPQGPIGETGTDGMDGQDGVDGMDGMDGQDGVDGRNGVTSIALQLIGRYETNLFDEGASEIVSYDPVTQQIFQVNANSGQVDVLNISDPTTPTLADSIDVAGAVAANTPINTVLGSVNSVSVNNGVVAAAIAAAAVDEPGVAVFFQASDLSFLGAYEVGFLPDSIAFSPDGMTAITANEGEPSDDYTVDPIGSISVIDISAGAGAATVTTLDFTDFNAGGARAGELDPEIRIFGVKQPGDVPSTVAEDLEPEYVAVSADSSVAYVSLQENNAIAVVDLATPRIDRLFSLGVTDHNRIGNELDASDRDNRINIRNWPIFGYLLPDTIATYEFQGQTMLLTANEGDTRDYDGFSEEERIRDLTLDPTVFPDAATLQADANIGRLLTTVVDGDDDGDGDYDRLFSIGGRSFSIMTSEGDRIFDSGNEFELVTSFRLEENFNADNDDNDGDSRSDAKGCEPEAISVGHIGDATFAFIGLERASGIMVYNISNPHSPRFVQYVNDRDFAEAPSLGDNDGDGIDEPNPLAGDIGPESILFISMLDSPTGADLLVVGNEVSGTTSFYQINVVEE